MIVIRLARVGRGNLKKFRLVAQEKTFSPKSGKFIEILGHYDPTEPKNKLTFQAERIAHFLKNGAQPSDTVARLLKKSGFDNNLIDKFIKIYSKKKSKKTEEEKPAETAKPEGEKAKPAEESDESSAKEESATEAKPEESKPDEEAKTEEASEKKPAEKNKKEESKPSEEATPPAEKKKEE